MKRVYISVINDLVTDQRVNRIVDLLKGEGIIENRKSFRWVAIQKEYEK